MSKRIGKLCMVGFFGVAVLCGAQEIQKKYLNADGGINRAAVHKEIAKGKTPAERQQIAAGIAQALGQARPDLALNIGATVLSCLTKAERAPALNRIVSVLPPPSGDAPADFRNQVAKRVGIPQIPPPAGAPGIPQIAPPAGTPGAEVKKAMEQAGQDIEQETLEEDLNLHKGCGN